MENKTTVPLILYESQMQQKTNIIKWLIATICFLILVLGIAIIMFVSFIGSYDIYGYSQDGKGINNVNSGEQGDVINESTIENDD